MIGGYFGNFGCQGDDQVGAPRRTYSEGYIRVTYPTQ